MQSDATCNARARANATTIAVTARDRIVVVAFVVLLVFFRRRR